MEFRYQVVRLWQQNAADLLRSGLATLPLAPLAVRSRKEVASVVQTLYQRLDTEADLQQGRELSAATFILLGLNYQEAFIKTLTQGVQKMKESSTYQMILREGLQEGRLKGLEEGRKTGLQEGRRTGRQEGRQEGIVVGLLDGERRSLMLQGTRRFGEPTEAQRARIDAATTREQLEVWLLSLLDASDWDGVFR
ncbi:MAG: hypothetical protein H7Y38_06050 [Armatimonadetes bacterium]|nr:hypothetical protein [Armatimonadota bacterium]